VLDYLPQRLELTKDALLIHGIYCRRGSKEKDDRRPWTIQLPLAELDALDRR
jgi:hypothetical protein